MQTTFMLEMDFGAQGSSFRRIQVAPKYID